MYLKYVMKGTHSKATLAHSGAVNSPLKSSCKINYSSIRFAFYTPREELFVLRCVI